MPPVALERYVPRVACEWELDAPDARWQVLDGTLCFVDISGFTNLSERLAMRGRIGVEELTEVLNRVFGTMLDLAFERGGSLLKFGGDALILLFDGPDHPVQGAAAAVEMRAALREATKVPLSVGRVHLRMSVGLHSGEVQLFRVGTLHHELIVTGPAATRTTRMEHAASAGEIFISPEMSARLPRGATLPGPDDTTKLRWRVAPVPAVGARLRRPVPDGTIARCLPAILRDHLGSGEVDFEHRVASVAFIRFQGLDSLLASAGPAAAADALHEVVSTVQLAADEEGVAFLASDIDEDGGKVILAGGVPRAQPDDEGRLLRAARAVASADLPLHLQIGVNQGHVVAGTIGATHRATYTVMGDTVNLAARLMAAAPHGSLYASPTVLDRARPLFDTRALPPFEVKGKARPVTAFEVGEEIGTREVDQEGPFVGRADERAQLVAVLRRADEAPAVVTVLGETGIGKSRVVAEAIEAAGVASFTVRGEPDGTTSPYRTFRDPLRALLGIERADQATMARRLRSEVERLDPSLLPLLPLIGAVAHIDTPSTPEVDAIDPRFLPDQRARALLTLLDAATNGPLAIVVEDAQWTDGASDLLLAHLASSAARRPDRSVVVLRRDVPGGFTPTDHELRIGPMPESEVRALLTAVTDAPLRPDEVQRVLDRAAGSPLVLHALLRVGRSQGTFDQLPDSLEGLITAEIDVLAPLPRLLLGYAAVLGRSFNPLVWQRILTADGFELSEGTVAELERFLVVESGSVATFRQAVVRDAAYHGLPYRRRRALHLRAGQVIEELAAGAVDSAAGLLSLHFHEAGDFERAWRYARLAGTNAQASYANDDAAALYRRALDAGRRLGGVDAADLLSTWTSLGDVLEQAGRLEEALDAYRRAGALAKGDDLQGAQLHLKRARVRERSGAYVAALRELRAAERQAAAAASDDAARVAAGVAAMRAIVHEGQEQPRRALAAAEVAAAEAERVGDLRELANAYNVMDWAHTALGELDQAVHQPRIVEIYQALGEPHRAAAAVGNQGALAFWRGRWDEARDCYERSHAAYVRAGDVVNAALQQANLAELLVNRGDLEAARSVVTEAAQTHRAIGFVDGALFAELQLGRLLLGEGDIDGASAVLESVVEEARSLSLHATALEASIHLGQCRIESGRAAEALELIEEAEARVGSDAALYSAAAALVRARALEALGDRDAAHRARAVGIEAAREMQLHFELGRLLLLDPEDAAGREEGHALLTALGVVSDQLTA